MVQKNAYFLNFNTQQFLGGKELLKSMPTFFNKVYFCSKYGNALWTGEIDETFSDIAMTCREEDIVSLRQIIKNNFLYVAGWDSLKFSEHGDYGFSFIAGNIKYILMPFRETETGYLLKYYEVDTGMCYDVNILSDKKFFLDSSINSNGEFVRLCDFNIENINEENSTKKMAEKKVQPQMAVYNSNSGHAIANISIGLIVLVLSFLIVFVTYSYISSI